MGSSGSSKCEAHAIFETELSDFEGLGGFDLK